MNFELNWTSSPDVKSLLSRASAHDGIDPLSEAFLRGLDDPSMGHRHLVAQRGGEIIGIAALSEQEAELVVDPDVRRKSVATALCEELQATVDNVQVWAHGNIPAAQAMAKKLQASVIRRLLVLEIAGENLSAAAQSDIPDTVAVLNLSDSIKCFGKERVYRAWIEANNEAFSWHPEQGGWDQQRLEHAMATTWFEPNDVLFMWDKQAEGTLAGFHWTKRHDAETAEVYVVGLANDYRGKGLGGPAVAMGLSHMLAQGAKRVILYVEDDNEAAVRRYKEDGFAIAEEHVVYAN